MPKTKVALEIRLPAWPRRDGRTGPERLGIIWKRRVYSRIMQAAAKKKLVWPDPTKGGLSGLHLEIDVLIYLQSGGLKKQDIDNLVKLVLDALQGRLSRPKAQPRPRRLVENDADVRRMTVEKKAPSKRGLSSRLVVRDYTKAERTRRRAISS